MNLIPLASRRIMITRSDGGPTALFTCRWKDGDVSADELDRIAEACRLMAASIRGEALVDEDGVEETFNAAATAATETRP